MLLHQAVQRGLLGPVSLVKQRAVRGVAQPRQRETEHLAAPKYCTYLQYLSPAACHSVAGRYSAAACASSLTRASGPLLPLNKDAEKNYFVFEHLRLLKMSV